MYNQSIVTSHYLRQWQNGELTDPQVVAILFRKYNELVRDYERLQQMHADNTPPNRTDGIRMKCEHCRNVFYARSYDAKYCSASHRQLAYIERQRERATINARRGLAST